VTPVLLKPQPIEQTSSSGDHLPPVRRGFRSVVPTSEQGSPDDFSASASNRWKRASLLGAYGSILS
jgi:hypothetical protein